MENSVRGDHSIHIGTLAAVALGYFVILMGNILLVIAALVLAAIAVAVIGMAMGVKSIRKHIDSKEDARLLDGEPELDSPYRNDPRDHVSPPSDPEEL